MKKLITILIVASLYSCSSNSTSGSADSIGVDASKAVVRKPDSVVQKTTTAVKADTSQKTANDADSQSGKWTYKDDVDKMTSKTTYYASIDANDLLDFPSPYDGGVTATLLIRHKGSNGNEAIVSITKGQFVNQLDGGSVKVRFDSAQPLTFSTSEPSDGSTTAIFIENTAKFLKKLKTSNKVIIEAEFYESGLKTMEFDVKDFKWEH